MTWARFGQGEHKVCAALILVTIGIIYTILWKPSHAGDQSIRQEMALDLSDDALGLSPHGPNGLPSR